MQKASDLMEFERAAEYRDLLQAISTLRTKQRVMSQDMMDRDIFGYYVDKGWMCSASIFLFAKGNSFNVMLICFLITMTQKKIF